jgi:multiple sugar transport system permease protein
MTSARSIGRYAVLVIASLFALFPVYWMLQMSIKPPAQWASTPPVWFTMQPTLSNYLAIFGQAELTTASINANATGPLFNSIVISVTATVLSVAFGTLAAWSISRFRIGGNTLPLFLLTPRMFPPIAVALPLLIMYTTLNLLNTRIGLIIAYTGFTIPFSVWMTKSFIDEVPTELEEAGMMDGLTRFQTFYKITLPMIKSGVAATSLFIFILNWSEFIVALTLTRSMDTVPVFINKLFSATGGTMYGMQAALGTISVVPMILIGYAIYEHLARGFTFGAIHK